MKKNTTNRESGRKISSDASTPGSRLQEVLDELGLPKVEVGRKIGANKDTIGRAIKQDRISKTILMGLQRMYNVNPIWLTEGKGSMYLIDADPVVEAKLKQELEEKLEEYKLKYIQCLEENGRLKNQLLSSGK